jgi:hypothetical protein
VVSLADAVFGCAGLVVGSLPDLVPSVAGVLAAEGGDTSGAADGPAHAGELEPLADDRLAAGLDHAGADEHAQGAEVLISHPVGIGLEVGQGLVSLGGQAADELQAAAGGQQGGDVPGVELGEALGEPVVAVAAEQPGGEGGQLVDVLAGVVEVDDLGGGGEVLAGQVPDLIPVPRLSR